MKLIYTCLIWLLAIGFCRADDFRLEQESLRAIEAYSAADYDAGRELLEKLVERGGGRSPVLDRPHTLVRSQTKYSGRLHQNYYNWYIRPLFASRMLWEAGDSSYKIASFSKTFDLYKAYGLDGFATFAWPQPGRLGEIFDVLYRTPEEMRLDPASFGIMLEITSVESYADIGEELFDYIVNHAHSFRINGKSVISSYVMDKWPADKIGGIVEDYRRRSGGKVLFLPQMGFNSLQEEDGRRLSLGPICKVYESRRAVPATVLLRMMDYLRSYARVCDGLYMGAPPTINDTTLDTRFSDEVLFPLYKAVLSEPEFEGKILAMAATVGYTSYHGAQSRSRDGTKTLRGCMELARKHRPDIIICPEWDELNEDTGFQPQVSGPMSTQRIMKYYTDSFKGVAPSPNPGDDPGIPNLIVSQRRQLVSGWTHDVEILNVPDSSESESFTVRLEVFDERGRVLFKSGPDVFDRSELQERTYNLPSEEFAESQVLRTRIITDYQGRERVFEEGLPFTVLRATVGFDQIYANTPLRNVLLPVEASVVFGNQVKDVKPGIGSVDLSVELRAGVSLAAAEVVQDSLEIFAWDPANEFLQNDDDKLLFKLHFMYAGQPCRERVNLTVDLENAPTAITFEPDDPPRKAKAGPAFSQSYRHGITRWRGANFSGAVDHWAKSRLIAISRAELDDAFLKVSGSPQQARDETFSWTVPFSEAGEYGVVSKVFESGLMLALESYHRPHVNPLPIGAPDVSFRRKLFVDNPNAILALRVISEDGKVYWSAPYAFNGKPAENKVVAPVYSNKNRGFSDVLVSADRAPVVEYEFSERYGNILHTPAGREFYAHAGGYLTPAIGFIGLESAGRNIPFPQYSQGIFKGADRPAPRWERDEDGATVLEFDGERGNFLALPVSFMPQRAGFVMRFEIKPAGDKPEYVLFHHGVGHYGGLTVGVKGGKLELAYVRRTPDHPELPSWSRLYFPTEIALRPDEWQEVIVRRDSENLSISVNGEKAVFPCEGIGLYAQPSGFGGRGARLKDGSAPFFKGQLRSLSIRHFVD